MCYKSEIKSKHSGKESWTILSRSGSVIKGQAKRTYITKWHIKQTIRTVLCARHSTISLSFSKLNPILVPLSPNENRCLCHFSLRCANFFFYCSEQFVIGLKLYYFHVMDRYIRSIRCFYFDAMMVLCYIVRTKEKLCHFLHFVT